MRWIWVSAAVALIACSNSADPAAPNRVQSSSEASASNEAPVTTRVDRAPRTFCSRAESIADGQALMDVDVAHGTLLDVEGLSDRHRAMIVAVIADAAQQMRVGTSWDSSMLVRVTNEICGSNLTPVTMTP